MPLRRYRTEPRVYLQCQRQGDDDEHDWFPVLKPWAESCSPPWANFPQRRQPSSVGIVAKKKVMLHYTLLK
jgi:hypothetical protein